eukprot:GSA120T00002835001.1
MGFALCNARELGILAPLKTTTPVVIIRSAAEVAEISTEELMGGHTTDKNGSEGQGVAASEERKEELLFENDGIQADVNANGALQVLSGQQQPDTRTDGIKNASGQQEQAGDAKLPSPTTSAVDPTLFS